MDFKDRNDVERYLSPLIRLLLTRTNSVCSCLNDKILICLFGPNRIPIAIHKDLAISQSSWFETKCKPAWKHNSQEIDCSEHSLAAFRTFATWLYTRNIDKKLDDAGDEDTCDAFRTVLEAYDTANLFMVNNLKNLIVDLIISRNIYFWFGFDKLQILDESGLTETKIGQVILKMHVLDSVMEGYFDMFAQAHSFENLRSCPAVMFALLVEQYKYRAPPWGTPETPDPCELYEHDDGRECSGQGSKASRYSR